jgi:hypothetical protein
MDPSIDGEKAQNRKNCHDSVNSTFILAYSLNPKPRYTVPSSWHIPSTLNHGTQYLHLGIFLKGILPDLARQSSGAMRAEHPHLLDLDCVHGAVVKENHFVEGDARLSLELLKMLLRAQERV